MLNLTRRQEQSIVIVNEETNEEVKVVVNHVSGKYANIGLEGPKKYRMHREEVYRRINKPTPDTESQ